MSRLSVHVLVAKGLLHLLIPQAKMSISSRQLSSRPNSGASSASASVQFDPKPYQLSVQKDLPQSLTSFFSSLLAQRIAVKAYKKRSPYIHMLGFPQIHILLWEKVPGHLLLLGVLRKRKRTPIKATFGVYLLSTSSTLITPFLAVSTPLTLFFGPGCSLRDHMDEDMSPSSTDLFTAWLGSGVGGEGHDCV